MKKLLLIAVVLVGCKDGIDLTGTVYTINSDGTKNSWEFGTFMFTCLLMVSAFYIGRLSHLERNEITSSQSFSLFICWLLIWIYILLPLIIFIHN